jgi:NTP pyrophosphatase (non-canonical NTP hydrolase)
MSYNVKDLNELAQNIFQANKAKGFWDKARSKETCLMLAITELSEAIEAHRKGKFAKVEDYKNHVEAHQEQSKYFKLFVKDSVEDEIADTFIRLLDYLGGFNISFNTLKQFQDFNSWLSIFKDNQLQGEFSELAFEVTKSITRADIEYSFYLLLKICQGMNIDIDFHIKSKLQYNSQRERLHGKKY